MRFKWVGLALVLGGCAAGESMEDEASVVGELAAQLDSIEAIFIPGSEDFVDAYLGFFADDAVLLPPGQASIEGISAVRDFYTSGFEGLEPLSLEYTELVGHFDGQLAVRRYTGRGAALLGADTLVLPVNRYVDVLRRTEEGWRILWHSWGEVPEGEP